MTDQQLLALRHWFKTHISTFREAAPAHQRSLDLKEEHTARVGAVITRLSAALHLPANARRLAATTALFHDLGRFPQYRRYRTFRDQDSENHAKLSLRELTRHRVLHILEPAERQLIGRAIIFHNRLRLPGHLDSETLRHCRLLRDADKVDILRVIADELRKPPAERNPVLTLGLDSGLEVREEVYQELFAKRVMGYAELRNANEFKVLQMSWVFDINFRPTLEILRERNDLEVIVATLPATTRRDQAWAFIQDCIDRGLDMDREEVDFRG